MPLADNNGHSSVGFDVLCCQMIEHHRSTLWPAPSQMERRSQAARRRLRRRPLIFRFGVRAALMGPPGLAKHETLVNAEEQETTTIGDAPLEDVPDETEVITLGEQEDEPDRPVETDIITFEEQDTRSLLRPVPRRASPHDDFSVAESKHVLFDEAEDPRSLLRPVPPN